MSLKVKIISQELIKPSSPTPDHLRKYKLSLLDQCADSAHVPLILYYSNANTNKKVQNEERVYHFKKTLSEMLNMFYPFAGRVNDNLFIDCNDEGVKVSEARVYCHLNKVYDNPISEELDQLLPPAEEFYRPGPKLLLSIQVTIFDCGGMAIGVSMSHKVADGPAFNSFLQSWAAHARGDKVRVLLPRFDFLSLFPPKPDLPSFSTNSVNVPPREKVMCKRFVFDASNVASLRAKCYNNVDAKYPSRVEAVFALIWRCLFNALRMRAKFPKSSSAAISMNMRARMDPPLSDNSFGNAIVLSVASSPIDCTKDVQSLVCPLRDAISKIDEGFVKKLQADEYGFLKYVASVAESYALSSKNEVEFYIFTTWIGTSFYEADFGWGKPAWVSSGKLDWKNLVLIMDTKCGKGVEAWVSLNEEDMTRFECDTELLSFSSTKQMLSKI